MIKYPNGSALFTASKTDKNKFKLYQDFSVALEGAKTIVIPKGYKTDGATIPLWIRFWIRQYHPQRMEAVLIHDYLCDKEQYKLADKYFEILLLDADDSFKHKVMILAVRVHHLLKYNIPTGYSKIVDKLIKYLDKVL